MYGLEGRRAIVTGATHGIGKAIARRLVKEGCSVAIWDIDKSAADNLRDELAIGGEAQAARCDVSDPQSVRAALDATIRNWGAGPEIFVNNAGIGKLGSILDTPEDDFEQTMRVNVFGTFNCSQPVARLMKERGGGQIINISSWFGKSGRPLSLAYCASKFALIGMTQSMALDLAPYGIRVNAVCPGTIDNTRMREEADDAAVRNGLLPAAQRTNLIPLGRLGQPEDIARVVAYLASDEADYLTGQSINATGGLWMN